LPTFLRLAVKQRRRLSVSGPGKKVSYPYRTESSTTKCNEHAVCGARKPVRDFSEYYLGVAMGLLLTRMNSRATSTPRSYALTLGPTAFHSSSSSRSTWRLVRPARCVNRCVQTLASAGPVFSAHYPAARRKMRMVLPGAAASPGGWPKAGLSPRALRVTILTLEGSAVHAWVRATPSQRGHRRAMRSKMVAACAVETMRPWRVWPCSHVSARALPATRQIMSRGRAFPCARCVVHEHLPS